MKLGVFAAAFASLLVLGVPAFGAPRDGGFNGEQHGQHTDDPPTAVHRDISPPLRSIKPAAAPQGPPSERAELVTPTPPSGPAAPDPVLQTSLGTAAAPTLGTGFEGVGNGFSGPAGTFAVNSAPPDTNGAVGPNHYVQIVNTAFAIFSKTGTVLYGPAPTNTLWSGFGGGCQTNNDGDASVVYDRAADRWIITQFSVNTLPYLQCVAISTTGDPTGSYYRYSFQYSDFPDYPKLGVWPDAYYVSFNLFKGGTAFSGPEVCAYDRAKMLAGLAATQQCFLLPTSYGSLLPSSVDSAAQPPAGSPNYLMDFGANSLELWKFHTDWTTPASSTLTGPTTIPVAAFSAACNGGGGCIPQPGTTQTLDSLADRLMYRLAYRNFGDHESLVVTHAITSGSSVGVRWYELRNPAAPVVYQQGTYAPDSSYRWMSSAAQDQNGDIALGFSVSSSTLYPGIHYTAHLTSDPLGVMGQGEGVLFDGAGSQLPTLGRWGDYSSMNVDPTDDCTFWFTSEYLAANGTFNWHTRIGSFKLAGCGVPDYSLSASPASQTVNPGQSTSYTVTVTPQGSFSGPVSLSVGGLPAGATATFTPNPATSTSTLSVTTDAATTPVGTYPLTITGTNGALTHTTSATLVVSQPDFSLSASPASRAVTQGQAAAYTVTVTPVAGFTGSVNLSASGLPAGAAATFSPNPATSTSSLSIATATSTPAGTYPVTITGTSGGLTHTTSVTLVVQAPAPDFALSASPTSRTVTRGSSTTYAITVNKLNGFAGSVSLSVSGLPSRTTASFSPNPATSSSTLTVSTRSRTPVGTFTLTVTGTSGGLTRTVMVTLVTR